MPAVRIREDGRFVNARKWSEAEVSARDEIQASWMAAYEGIGDLTVSSAALPRGGG